MAGLIKYTVDVPEVRLGGEDLISTLVELCLGLLHVHIQKHVHRFELFEGVTFRVMRIRLYHCPATDLCYDSAAQASRLIGDAHC